MGFLHHLRTPVSLLLVTTIVTLYFQSQRLDKYPRIEVSVQQEIDLLTKSNNVSSLGRMNSSKTPQFTPGDDVDILDPSNGLLNVPVSHSIHRRFIKNTTKQIPQNDLNATEQTEQKPILIYSTMNINRKEPCDIPCVYTSRRDRRLEADASVYERRGYSPPEEGDKFSIYLQMEGEHYYPIELDQFHLENSYRWVSPLLKPYFEWIIYRGPTNISNPPVPFESTINGASFIARNCYSKNRRESFVKSLRKQGIRVDGLSNCLQTVIPPQSQYKLPMMRPYKFNLAFENGNVQDYVTEKVYEALSAGVVPVYMGAPNIRDFVPDHSIIDVADFDFNATLVALHLKECMTNQSLYESYHAWRYRALPEWFLRKFNFTWDTTECRTCRYVDAMQKGWKWDQETQRGIPPMT